MSNLAADSVTPAGSADPTAAEASERSREAVASGINALPGFRLHRLEMLNWGTFHQKVAVLAPAGRWSLLVGENGSGKTTAVDALRTLLVPPRQLQYNDASGDQKRRDRTRRSYVRGAWATSSQEDTAAARVEYLRKPGEQSILLAVFADEGRATQVTLAQILWEANETVHEIYGVARGDRNIRDDLANLGRSNELKKTLRARGFEPFDHFPGYEETFRSRLGIPGRGALEVFNQAIGVKEIVDVNSFVRRHMLEPSDALNFIEMHLKPHYRELDACYQAIQKARTQVEQLEPIAQCHKRLEEASARKTELERLQQITPLFYSQRQLGLRQHEGGRLARELADTESRQTTLQEEQDIATGQRIAIELDLNNDAVGLRIKSLELDKDRAIAQCKARQGLYGRVRDALSTLQKPWPFDSAETFATMRAQVETSKGLFEGNLNSARAKRIDAEVEERGARVRRGELADDLESLRSNRVLIPRDFLSIRHALSEATHIPSEDLPFAGELIEVNEDYQDWTGAIERLLRSFGISLLVPERHYVAVSSFINRQHLGLRLQYHRVPTHLTPVRPALLLDNERVAGRLRFREDHPLQTWVKTEVCRRFSHICCDDIQRLREVDYGITREGLIRNGPTHHIKDDSRRINDITSYVLGWSTEAKLRALTRAFETAESAVKNARERAETAGRQCEELERKLVSVDAVLSVAEFRDVDYRTEQQRIERIQREQDELEASSDRRKELKKQLELLITDISKRQREILELSGEAGGLKREHQFNQTLITQLEATFSVHPDLELTMYAETMRDLQEVQVLTLQNIDATSAAVARKVQSRINQQSTLINRATAEMLPLMTRFLSTYNEETSDKKAEVAYGAEFVALQERLQKEDLPTHERKFEEFLSVNLIGDVAMFSTKLDEHRKDIESRVATVNRALKGIRFSETTHVQIVSRSKGAGDETAAFRAELKACLAGGLNPGPDDRVRIFGHIRELIDKFEKDLLWAARVTDARNWLEFGMREHADSDNREINYYSASSGKSGGQKTKLAFTILASAICAQYGLIESDGAASTFRFVVIDEAFARTDETNSERALKLFKSLGLQLLIVSPFDAKSRIVEDYVDTFHLALNPELNNSRIRVASRADYDATREEAVAVTATGHD